MAENDSIQYCAFSDINLQDSFFDSLRDSYDNFNTWFHKKAREGEHAYVSFDGGKVIAFLYLKKEEDDDNDTVPPLTEQRMKIGTFKVDLEHHSKMGKRLLAIALRAFAESKLPYVYVTFFDAPHTQGLRKMFDQYGFRKIGTKDNEQVWAKFRPTNNTEMRDTYANFPFIALDSGHKNYYMPIFPDYHARMFPTRLTTEKHIAVEDMVSTNSIEKIYLSNMSVIPRLRKNDRLIIYRTKPKGASSAHYSSVVTAIGTVVEIKDIHSFSNYDSFHAYINGRSVFTEAELREFWTTKKYCYIIRFVDNFAFTVPFPNRETLLAKKLLTSGYVGGQIITDDQLRQLARLGGNGESYYID